MKIEFTETVKQKKEIDIQFPIYREHDVTGDEGPSTIIYTKIEAIQNKLRATEIWIFGHNKAEIEIDDDYKFDGSEPDYLFGRGFYKSLPENFAAALNKAKTLIDSISSTPEPSA